MPMARKRSKRSVMSAFDNVLEVDDAEHLLVRGDDERRAAHVGDLSTSRLHSLPAASPPTNASIARPRLCDICVPLMSTPLMRVWAVNGTKSRGAVRAARVRAVRISPLPARRCCGLRASRPASEASWAASASPLASRLAPEEFRGLAIAERDRAGLIQQQHVDVARRFDRAPAHREHILLHQAIDAGDADGAEASRQWSSESDRRASATKRR